MKLKITFLSICLLAFGNFTMAQTSTTTTSSSSTSNYGLPKKKDFDRFSAGISVGVNYFQADFEKNSQNNNNLLKDLPFDLMYGVQLGYQLTHSVGIRARGMFGKFTAEGKEFLPSLATDQYFYYDSPVSEGVLDAVFTMGNVSFLQRNKKFHILASVGVGFFNYDGTIKDSLTKTKVYETGNVTEGMLTLGLGFKYQIGKRIDAGICWDFRKTLTDKVDGIDKPTTESDNYSIVDLSINYTFGKKQQQLEWVNPMEVVYNDMAELKDKMDVISGDKDKDGVSDMFDKDNSTAEGLKVYGDGTTVDTDADGIADAKDADPFTAKGAKVDANGVEIDTDGDGVPDSRDLEPNTAKGSLVNFQGISIDKAGSSKMGVGWLPSVFFALNRSDIAGIQRDRILVIARVLKNNPDLKIKITGNCDITAGEDYNDKLGMKRAESVKNHLIKTYGIDAARLTTESKGEKDPMAKGINQMNRRVDFSVNQE